MSDHPDRSYETLTYDDLGRLSERVIGRLREKEKPIGKLICIGLIQNGARHYLNSQKGEPGIKPGLHDFDVLCLFSELATETRQRAISAESKLDKFGACRECGRYRTRKIDIFCKRLAPTNSIEASVASYFENGKGWAQRAAEGPCIGMWPNELRGKELWRGTKPAKA